MKVYIYQTSNITIYVLILEIVLFVVIVSTAL